MLHNVIPETSKRQDRKHCRQNRVWNWKMMIEMLSGMSQYHAKARYSCPRSLVFPLLVSVPMMPFETTGDSFSLFSLTLSRVVPLWHLYDEISLGRYWKSRMVSIVSSDFDLLQWSQSSRVVSIVSSSLDRLEWFRSSRVISNALNSLTVVSKPKTWFSFSFSSFLWKLKTFMDY